MKFKIFEGLTKKKPKKEEEHPKILPFDIRYALLYGKSILSKEDIETLVRNNFENEALYLTFKSLTGSPDEHRALLEKYISYILESDANQKINKNILQKLIIKALADKDDISVKGAKLAQLSRQGFDFWQEKFKQMATQLGNDNREVWLVTHPMLVGLSSFIQVFSEKNKTLNILVPPWLENENIGYIITFNNRKANIEWLHIPFNKKDLVLVDDTRNTGNTLKKIRKYLLDNGCPEPEMITMDNTSSS